MEKVSDTKDYEKYLKMTEEECPDSWIESLKVLEEAFGFSPIKNCPVCGSEDLVHHHKRERVECIKCGYVGGGANYWESRN